MASNRRGTPQVMTPSSHSQSAIEYHEIKTGLRTAGLFFWRLGGAIGFTLGGERNMQMTARQPCNSERSLEI